MSLAVRCFLIDEPCRLPEVMTPLSAVERVQAVHLGFGVVERPEDLLDGHAVLPVVRWIRA